VAASLIGGSVWARDLAQDEGFEGIFEPERPSYFWRFAGNSNVDRVTSPTREGTQALRFKLDRAHDENAFRTQLVLEDPGHFLVGTEYWYGFSFYLPSDWVSDTTQELLAEWWPWPDKELGESNARVSALALRVDGDQWLVTNCSDSAEVTHLPSGTYKVRRFDLGPVSKGEWTDWVFHVKWSYQSDGVIEIWKNGVQVVQATGQNAYNDNNGSAFVIGLYKSSWMNAETVSLASTRTVYFDSLRIGEDDSGYNAVAAPIRAPNNLRQLSLGANSALEAERSER